MSLRGTMSKQPAWLWRMRSSFRRGGAFIDDERGVTAIEFAILALPFFTIVFAILETSIVFFAGQILDSAVQDAGRLARTGRAQNASYSADDFRAAVCSGLYTLFDCSAAALKIKVSVVDSFANATVTSPVETGAACTPNCDWTIVTDYSPGVGNDIVLVQAYYKWPTLIHLPGFNLQDQPDGTRLLGSVRVFKNEPF